MRWRIANRSFNRFVDETQRGLPLKAAGRFALAGRELFQLLIVVLQEEIPRRLLQLERLAGLTHRGCVEQFQHGRICRVSIDARLHPNRMRLVAMARSIGIVNGRQPQAAHARDVQQAFLVIELLPQGGRFPQQLPVSKNLKHHCAFGSGLCRVVHGGSSTKRAKLLIERVLDGSIGMHIQPVQ